MDTNSWTWDEYNITNSNEYNYDNNLCENITNHWLYFVFSGYLLPLISPTVRDWFKETLNSLKNNKVTAQLVTLTEFGFNKIQDIESDEEMKKFIKRLCKSKQPGILIQDKVFDNLAKEFSGKDGGKSWKYLMKILNSNIGHKLNRP